MREYRKVLDDLEEQVDLVMDQWVKIFDSTHDYQDPSRGSVRKFIKLLGVEEVMDAVHVTAAKFNFPLAAAKKYFYGICWNKVEEVNE